MSFPLPFATTMLSCTITGERDEQAITVERTTDGRTRTGRPCHGGRGLQERPARRRAAALHRERRPAAAYGLGKMGDGRSVDRAVVRRRAGRADRPGRSSAGYVPQRLLAAVGLPLRAGARLLS